MLHNIGIPEQRQKRADYCFASWLTRIGYIDSDNTIALVAFVAFCK